MVSGGKKRGVGLTIWLILMLIANFFTTLAYLLLNKTIASAYPSVDSEIFYFYGLLSLGNLLFVIFLFNWKKWAFYAFCVTSLIAFGMNLAVVNNYLASIIGLLGPIILYLFMKPKWNLFE